MAYRHFRKDKIAMDFSFFAIVFKSKIIQMLLREGCNDLHTLNKAIARIDFMVQTQFYLFLSYK